MQLHLKKLALHPTKDNFETAVDLLTRNLIKQIARKQGANMSTNQRLAEHPKYNVKTSVRSTDTMQELWDYIKIIQIPLAQIQIIFNYVYSRACNYYRDRGNYMHHMTTFLFDVDVDKLERLVNRKSTGNPTEAEVENDELDEVMSFRIN